MILGITIILIKSKKIKELFKHMGIFILGILIVSIPIIIYFSCKNSIYDMLYGTFIHNFLYINANIPSYTGIPFYGIILLKFVSIFPLLISFLISCVFIKNQNNLKIVAISIILITTILSFSGPGFLYYYIMSIPIFTATLGILLKKIEETGLEKTFSVVINISMISFCIAFSLLSLMSNIHILFKKEYLIKKKALTELVQNIPDKENILIYSITSAYYYLYIDVIPEYKYAFSQQHLILSSNKIKKEIIDDMKSGTIKYIVIYKDIDIDNDIYNTIGRYYVQINESNEIYSDTENHTLTLYRYNR